MISVLFVCTGNICRSPTAEGILRLRAEERNIPMQIDSAGMIAYHSGEAPDPRTCKAAREHGVDLSHQRARQIRDEDFDRFDHILAMDESHFRDLKAMAPEAAQEKIRLFLSFIPEASELEIPDPYYGGPDGFSKTIDLVEQGSAAFLDHLSS